MVRYKESDFENAFVEVSEFSVLFPSYREKYIKENFDAILTVIKSKKLDLMVDYKDKSLCIKTNKRTRDPYVIIKGRDFLKLISRSVPLEESSKIFEENVFCDIIKIKNEGSKEVVERRKKRLMGKNNSMIKALSLLTKCYIEVYGGTVSCVGPYRGVKEVGHVVLNTMENIHPVFLIRQLITKKKLEKDKRLKDESWDRYIPPASKKTIQ